LCWQTVEQQFIPALAIASTVMQHIKKQDFREIMKELAKTNLYERQTLN